MAGPQQYDGEPEEAAIVAQAVPSIFSDDDLYLFGHSPGGDWDMLDVLMTPPEIATRPGTRAPRG